MWNARNLYGSVRYTTNIISKVGKIKWNYRKRKKKIFWIL